MFVETDLSRNLLAIKTSPIVCNSGEKNEIIVYQPEGGEFHIEATVLEDTIWLTQFQIAELFGTKRQAITKHLTHIFQDEELEEKSVSSKMELTAADGKRYLTNLYNLDAILSVGYRVNSKRATQFRRWANQVLKEHLLKGGSVNQRLISHENKLENLDARVQTLEKNVDFFVKANLPQSEGILNAKSWWSGYEFAAQLVRSAKEEIDMRDVHDRFIIVDSTIYHVGASIRDLGNKLTAFSVLSAITKEQLLESVK